MSTETQHLLLQIMQSRLETDIVLLATSPPPMDRNVETELCHRMVCTAKYVGNAVTSYA